MKNRTVALRSLRVIFSLGLTLVTLALVSGCQPAPNPTIPWSLQDQEIPNFEIITEEVTFDTPKTAMVTAVVDPSISHDDLTLVSQKIIEQQPKHELALIFYYENAAQVEDPFTVGKAWWGVENYDESPPLGDYSHHTLKVQLKSAELAQ